MTRASRIPGKAPALRVLSGNLATMEQRLAAASLPSDPIDPLNRARAVLTYWPRHNLAVVDIAWSRLSESDLPDDRALMADVARERVAQMGVDLKALPFNAARFPKVQDDDNRGHLMLGWVIPAMAFFGPILVGLAAYGAYKLGGKLMFWLISMGVF